MYILLITNKMLLDIFTHLNAQDRCRLCSSSIHEISRYRRHSKNFEKRSNYFIKKGLWNFYKTCLTRDPSTSILTLLSCGSWDYLHGYGEIDLKFYYSPERLCDLAIFIVRLLACDLNILDWVNNGYCWWLSTFKVVAPPLASLG